MVFKKVTLQNFFSFGPNVEELDLSKPGLYLILGENGEGKCVAKNTKIKTKQLGEVNIQDLYDEAEFGNIYSPDEPLEVWTDDGWKQIEAFWITEPQEMYELELEDGRILRASEDHRVMTKDGWKKLKNLNENDIIITE